MNRASLPPYLHLYGLHTLYYEPIKTVPGCAIFTIEKLCYFVPTHRAVYLLEVKNLIGCSVNVLQFKWNHFLPCHHVLKCSEALLRVFPVCKTTASHWPKLWYNLICFRRGLKEDKAKKIFGMRALLHPSARYTTY